MDHVHSVTDLVTSPSADFQFTKEELRGWQSKGVVNVDFALDISRVYEDVTSAPGNLPISSSGLSGLNAANDTASAATPTFPVETLADQTNQPTYVYSQDFLSTPALHSVASEAIGTSRWTGVDSLVTHLTPLAHNGFSVQSSSATTSVSWEQEQAIYAIPSRPVVNEAGLLTLEYDTNSVEPVIYSWTICPGEQGTSGPTLPDSTTVGNGLAVTPIPDLGFRKCRHGTEAHGNGNTAVLEGYEVLPQKWPNGGDLDGVPMVAVSGNDTLHESVARTQRNKWAPKAMGRETETLAALNTHGMRHPSLLGPSIQQGWLMAYAQNETPWDEGRVEKKGSKDIDGVPVMQQWAKNIPIPIPKNLDEEFRTLLAATEADWKSETIQRIMCRLCREARFKTWDRFKRHCNTTEAHPLKIAFCNRCGDVFSRSDSLRRHRDKPPFQCRNAMPEKAEEKRRVTEKAHKEFKERLKHCGKTGEEVGGSFAHIIKMIYPDSSKKRTGSKE